MAPMYEDHIFTDLFVLEMANNHWGDVSRGKQIIKTFAEVVRRNNIKAAIKMQFRDVDSFIHKDYKGNEERYISKTEKTRLSFSDFCELTDLIVNEGCIPMATPFDEISVGWCEDLNYPIIKIASSDINDWHLLNRIAEANKAVILSTGGASAEQIDAAIQFFDKCATPVAVNHCVSLYPCEDNQLELSQIDYLKERYPSKVIGLSSHEYNDWTSSMLMSYAKGARTWERHIDIDDGSHIVSPYCSLPHQVEEWFRAFRKAQEMDGSCPKTRREITTKESKYLENLSRGVYAKCKIPQGTVITSKNFNQYFYQAIPLQKGQLSGRENIIGAQISNDIAPHEGLFLEAIDNVCMLPDVDTALIKMRGRERKSLISESEEGSVSSSNRKRYMSKLHLRKV